ncbi:MAG: hypothetical protein K0S41_3675 [Anaerocolumna sp.]|jgi:hypothetical protein|nr:hypothetical protein [Anaerocolumna sp.]
MSIININLKYPVELNNTVKELLISEGITVNDTKLSLIIDNVYNVICKYLGVSSDVYSNEYFTAIIQLAVVYYNMPQGFDKVTTKTQGARSQTISTNYSSLDSEGLTQLVKSMLPRPTLRVI